MAERHHLEEGNESQVAENNCGSARRHPYSRAARLPVL
jgi:hypothetical protein